ncbi:flavin reductase family protein [Oceanospirillum beijerinckii]|uniref:flavin reductase family protein n=1 Tax=Oceanospirillum beijerinckii TaxID=64976 RepID=UPI0003F6A511|nr:flavin reductase family protein [Oceanospirillum beijerinckii]
MDIKTESLSPIEAINLLGSTVYPRPIAWVSTVSEEGTYNLAPFSYFNVASVNPAIVSFSVLLNGKGEEKDTLINLKANEHFVVNMVDARLAEQMNQTSEDLPADVDEFALAGLTPVAVESGPSPAVKESLAWLECRLHSVQRLGDGPLAGNLVLGEVVSVHIDDQIWQNGRVNMNEWDLIAKLGGLRYSSSKEYFNMKRPG